MNKEQLKVGDYIESKFGDKAYVDKILKNQIRIIVDGKKCYLGDGALIHWSYGNPIKDDRIIGSKTFAIRFKQFLDWIPKEFYMSGPHILEEYEYMQMMAERLLNYQIQTATDEKEIEYLKRLNLIEK